MMSFILNNPIPHTPTIHRRRHSIRLKGYDYSQAGICFVTICVSVGANLRVRPNLFGKIEKDEKVLACYQHACLIFEDKKAINNQSVMEIFGIERNKSSVASRIIANTLDKGLIKMSDDCDNSKTVFCNSLNCAKASMLKL